MQKPVWRKNEQFRILCLLQIELYLACRPRCARCFFYDAISLTRRRRLSARRSSSRAPRSKPADRARPAESEPTRSAPCSGSGRGPAEAEGEGPKAGDGHTAPANSAARGSDARRSARAGAGTACACAPRVRKVAPIAAPDPSADRFASVENCAPAVPPARRHAKQARP